MIKTVSIYRNIENMELFKQFYTKVIFPRLHKMPGVLYTDVTSLAPLSDKMSERLKGTHLILETYFESQEALQYIFNSPEGYEIMKIIEDHSPGEMNSFMGMQKRFHADSYKDNKNEDTEKQNDLDKLTYLEEKTD